MKYFDESESVSSLTLEDLNAVLTRMVSNNVNDEPNIEAINNVNKGPPAEVIS